MSKITKLFRLAKEVAQAGSERRQHWLGAVGVRTDGAVVTAYNLPCRRPTPTAHAESRVVRKLDHGSTVYVVRVSRRGKLMIARPCKACRAAMRCRGITRCYYSISDTEYGVMNGV